MKANSGLGIAALVLSIIGFMTGFLRIGVALDVIAVVLAIVVLVKAKKQPLKTGLPIAGIIIAGVSMVLCFGLYGGGFLEKQPSKSEMMAQAQEVDFRELAIEKYENQALFVKNYDESICILQGIVENIEASGEVRLVWRTGNQYIFTESEMERMGGDDFFAATYDLSVQFVDEAEALRLEKGSTITVVGILDAEMNRLQNAYPVEAWE